MHEAVEDRVGDSRMSDLVVPVFDRHLAGDHGGVCAVTVFENLEHVPALKVGERHESPIIKDEHIGFGEAREQACVGSVSVRSVHGSRRPTHHLTNLRACHRALQARQRPARVQRV